MAGGFLHKRANKAEKMHTDKNTETSVAPFTNMV